MKNKWLVFGTLLGVVIGAGILYFGVKKYKEINKEKSITRAKMKRLMDK